jgi:hypothetical protein
VLEKERKKRGGKEKEEEETILTNTLCQKSGFCAHQCFFKFYHKTYVKYKEDI